MADREYAIEHVDGKRRVVLPSAAGKAIDGVAYIHDDNGGRVEAWLVVRVPLSREALHEAVQMGLLEGTA